MKVLQLIRQKIIQLIDFFYFPFLQFIPKELFRYGATGGMNTALDLLLYHIFYKFILKKQILELGFVAISPHIAAFLLVFPITFTTGFLLAKYITFSQSPLKGKTQFFRYVLSVAGAIILNYLFLKLFVEYFNWQATFSKFVTTIIVIFYSFMIQRYFTFNTKNINFKF